MAEAPKTAVRKRRVQKGEPFVWLSGGAIMTGLVMICGIVALIVFEGARTFWPGDIEVIALGQARFTLATADGKRAFLDTKDRLLFADGEKFVLADPADNAAIAGKPRAATIADYRRDPKRFAGHQWRLIDASGVPLKDATGGFATPADYLANAAKYPSPSQVPDENGKFIPIEQAFSDDTLRDHALLMGVERARKDLDLRDLPRKEDGSPWQSYELDKDPTELLVRQGNKGEGLLPDDQYFRWVKSGVPDEAGYMRGNENGWNNYVLARRHTRLACEIERLEKGLLCGWVIAVQDDGKVLAQADKDGLERVWEVFIEEQEKVRAEHLRRVKIEKDDIGDINAELKRHELDVARIRYDHRKSGAMVTALEKLNDAFAAWTREEPLAKVEVSEEAYARECEQWRAKLDEILAAWQKAIAVYDLSEDERADLEEARQAQVKRGDLQAGPYAKLRHEVTRLRDHETKATYTLRALDGKTATLHLAQIVRAFQPNELSVFGKLGVYFSRTSEFLFDEPREANTEGGIFPVIIGTLIMTLLLSIAVVPFGVITALYLREYAKQGVVVSAVRIAVNNLAGVPSIVFGIFGLGFFCVIAGGTIDKVFYPEALPSPTFGGGGVLWASLTLALMTVPVVVVATEEALLAVPSSQREASLACGASRFQTIWRVILPQATPGILTGMILAMARGAGEVAPLMLVGAVKLAPSLPIDGSAPFVHLDRKFMHLGFHIYDVGFQSPNVDSTKPLVFTTTLVLIGLVGLLNIVAIRIRNKLRQRLASSHV